MATSVQITLIICGTIVMLNLFDRILPKEKKVKEKDIIETDILVSGERIARTVSK